MQQNFKATLEKINFRKIFPIVMIVILVILGILVGFLEYNLNELKRYMPIAILDFPEDEWIKVNSAKIYSFDPEISPNDQLFLQLNITNKKPFRFDVEPIIYVDVGGEILRAKKDFGSNQIGINYTGTLPYYAFFASNEGQNNVKTSLLLSFRNNTFIKYENSTTTSFHVLSISDKILLDQNKMVFLGIIVSAIGVGSVSIINAYQTKLTRDEKNLIQRAWVGASQNLRLENPSQLLFPYTNYGKIPTSNIKLQYLISVTKITRRDLYESNLIQMLDLGTIMPTMKQDLMIGLTKDQNDHASSGKEFYVGILISYSYGNRKNGEYGVIYYYNHTSNLFLISEEWTDASEKLPHIEGVRSRIVDKHTGISDSSGKEEPLSDPLKKVLTEDVTLSDENNNRVLSPQVNQLVRIGLTIKNNQNKSQEFVYLVQAQDETGATVNLHSATASLEPWQFLRPTVVWVPRNPGEYFIQIFVWEKLEKPHALAPPMSFQITVIPKYKN